MLLKLANRAEKQINSHLDKLLDLAKDSPDRGEYQQVVREIMNEIRILRRWRTGLWIAAGALILFSAIAGWSALRDYRFVNSLRESQLALRFDDDGISRDVNASQDVGLSVVVDTKNIPFRSSANLAEAAQAVSDRVPTLGMHYGIGPNRRLQLSAPSVLREDGITRWFLKPDKPYTERLGYIDLSERLGSLDLRQWSERLRIGQTEESARRYKNLNTFSLRVIGYHHGAPRGVGSQDSEGESMLLWHVQFGEEKDNKMIWNPTIVPVLQTPVSRIDMEPIYLSYNGWGHVYIVTIGLGKFVEDPKPNGAIHRVTSYVRRLSLR